MSIQWCIHCIEGTWSIKCSNKYALNVVLNGNKSGIKYVLKKGLNAVINMH